MPEQRQKYGFPTETIPSLSFEDHLTDLAELAAFCESRGVSTKNTRIERYQQYLKASIKGDHLNEAFIFKNALDARFKSSYDWQLYVLREIHELMWILRGLKAHTPRGLDEKLKIIVGGNDFAALDKQSHNRNVQFELRIASYFCQAGCEVDLSSTTDVIATIEDCAFFVECKRIASMAQLTRRITEAKNQLEKKVPQKHDGRLAFGCIAADVTKVAFSHNGLTIGMTSEHSKDVVQAKLISISDIVEKLPLFTERCEIVQCWLQVHIAALVLKPPMPMTRFSSVFILNPILEAFRSPVVIQMRRINEVAKRGDGRELPSIPLKRRTNFTIPKDSTFWFDPELLWQLIREGAVGGIEDEVIVAGLKMDGADHKFSFFDLENVILAFGDTFGELMKLEYPQAAITLIGEMYLHRFPFEDS